MNQNNYFVLAITTVCVAIGLLDAPVAHADNCASVPTGIVAWWQGEGDTVESIAANNTVLMNGTSFTNGEVGSAFNLNGINNYLVATPSQPSNLDVGLGSGLSFEEWIKPNTVTAEELLMEYERFLGTQNGADVGIGFAIHADQGGILHANLIDTNYVSHVITSPGGLLTPGVWQHVAITYDKSSGQAAIYINGAAVSVANFGNFTPLTSFTNLLLGARTFYNSAVSPSSAFSGAMDEISLYNRALSSNEIAAIYLAGSYGKCSSTTPPTITAQPTNQTVLAGGTAIFTVGAAGTPTLLFQWSFNGTNLIGATNATLTLNNAQPNQSGNYSVSISNTYGSTNSTTVVLTVSPPPSCTPVSSGIAAWWAGENNVTDSVGGNNAVLANGTSFATGEVGTAFKFNDGNFLLVNPATPSSLDIGQGSGLTFEEWINPDNVSSEEMLIEYERALGTSSGADVGIDLAIHAASPTGILYGNLIDTNYVSHIIASPAGLLAAGVWQHIAVTYDKTSGIANLYLNGASVAQANFGTFAPITSFTNVLLGARTTFNSASSPSSRYSGQMDEISLYNRALSSNEIAAIYLAGSAGKCAGSPPAITAQPTNQTVLAGGMAMFAVSATGTAPLSYQWSCNGTNLPGATSASLTLANVQAQNGGYYSVLVRNWAGITVSSNALLVVNPAAKVPVITSFTPGAAGISNIVTLTGANFDPVAANNLVYFGAVKAAVLAAGPTSLSVSVPAGALYAPITVTVSGLTAAAPAPFLPTFQGGMALSSSSLAAPLILGSGDNPARMVIGDLDGDGKPDLVILNSTSVYIYRNISTNGTLATASFAQPVALNVVGGNGNPDGLALADIDGDGRLDIVFENLYLDQVFIFQNFCSPGTLGTNSFGTEVAIPVSGNPRGIAVADLDGDGLPDVVVANSSGSSVSILKNLGGSVISATSFATPVYFATGTSPVEIRIADVDGDGLPDLVTANSGDPNHKVSILRNLGLAGSISTNSFAPAVDLAGGDQGETIAVGDLDGDGKPDLVVGSYVGQTIAVYQNTSVPGQLGTNSFAAPTVLSVGARVHTVALSDLVGDGKLDLTAVTELPSGLVLYQNLSTPGTLTSSSFGPQLNFSSQNNAIGIVIGDLDGDGRPDIVFGNQYSATVEIYQNVNGLATPPVITTQPTYETVIAGASASFSVTAIGAAPFSYQWFYNQTNPLTGANNATLTLTNVQLGQAGNYSVVVSNYLGTVTSSNAFLTVIAPPIIAAQPTNQTVIAGNTASFSVVANGGAPLNYQWYFDLTNLLAGATNTSLTLVNAQAQNGGYYSVVVSNAFGAVTSSYALLTVYTPPLIVSQPTNQTVTVGGQATFTVSASGTTPLTYQWYFNNTTLLTGATNAMLHLNNVQPANGGGYSVVVGNVAGYTVSSNAVLTVNAVTNVPFITSFTPGSAGISNTVTITGAHFDPVAANNLVYFGAVKAAVLSANPTSLSVSMPPGALYAPITVTVNGLTAFAPAPFLPTFLGGGALSSASLAAPFTLVAGNNPVRVAVADLDGDGKPDLLVANSTSVYVYRNTSTNGTLTTGSLAPPVALVVAGSNGNLVGLALADLDGDGRLDIVTADSSLNRVSVFQNLSSPGNLTTNSFGAEVGIAVGGSPAAVAVADLDGDGKPDIITANSSGNSISILKNLGGHLISAAGFASPVNFAVGRSPSRVLISDIDGDGLPDLLTVNQGDANHKVSILRNLGIVGIIATNSFAASVDLAGADTGETMTVGDLDGDGKPDLVVGSYIGQDIAIYRNTSSRGSIATSSFAAPVVFAVGGRVHNVAVGDLDGDGKPDIAVVTEIPSSLALFKNLSTPGGFTSSSLGSKLNFGTGWNTIGVAIDDLDGDGRPDITVLNQYDGTMAIYQNLVPFGTPPAITAQPGNQTGVVGGTASFSVTTTGAVPLSYQWFFNQTNLLAGASTPTLTLTNIQFAQAGAYSVLVSNSLGFTNSTVATLTVVTPPTITQQPQSQSIPSYNSASFTVAATGSGTISYQWQKNGTNLVDNDNVTGSGSANLALASVSVSDAGNYSVLVTSPYGATNSAVAVLTVPQTIVYMTVTNKMSGNTVVMPIMMNALGVENSLLGSVGYDPTKLALKSVQLGQATTGAYLQEVDSQTNNGYVGFAILLNTGSTIPAGTQEVANVIFQTLPVTNSTTVSVTFGDSPTSRQLVDNNLDSLPAIYQAGSIQLTPAEYCADVYPRTNGDHVLTVQDWLEVGRMVAGLDVPTNSDEFLRADCAPRNAPDGQLTAADWVQAGRYALGLDPLTLVSAPASPMAAPKLKPAGGPAPSRTLVVGNVTAQRGAVINVPVQLVCATNENAAGLTVGYNTNLLRLLNVSLGSALTGGRLNVNSNRLAGKVGILVALSPGATLPAGTNQVAVLQFLTTTNGSGAAAVTLDNSVVNLQVADLLASPLATSYVNGAVTLPPQPTIAWTTSGSNLQFSWPVNSGTFLVQTADQPTGPWTSIILPLTTNGGNVTATCSSTNQQQYFRLQGQ